ncbi:MAG: cyclic nucleotide-binding domain-containing protein [Anaerolineales bacterium]|jgi:CRP/FNR family transcriptional regulator|nr:cyclic nucleotide-binding domain-containing protein [Chloroflexota bacterium]MBK6646137.1 cyclic nucleotide-binding domain-containing protein [Anaerolineales bacterium]MCC6986691.1 cyclic nucleotide-binding domain-containing protein [Anaerolineales bacterium]
MLDVLPVIPLFDGFSQKQASVLAALFDSFSCPPHTVVFEQGDPPNYLYLILKGRVSIVYKPYDAPQITITRLKEGDIFGWSAVIGGKRYTSSVISDIELETIRIRRSALLSLVADDPETGSTLIDRLALNVSPRWKNAHQQIQQYL